MTHTNKIGAAILLSTLLISNLSFAASCYEQSPNYTSMGDKYFDLDSNTSLTASDKKIINSSLKKMVGNWKGKGTLFQCLGPEFAPIAENKQFSLSAKISTNSSNELHVDAEKYLLNEKIKSQDHLFFFGAANNYRSALITPNKIVLVESFRQERIEEPEEQEKAKNKSKEKPKKELGKKKAQKKIRPFYEMVHTIEHNKTHFNYSLHRYINGSLAVEERWQLVR